ncbi:uncharacterized protein LOC116289481 [Actinia tenebrosa]|uniref:Uncharacterized protein LOC116289481 n=1 Tax=Actinia tenebrosa TaxID=6105 RepID=A0A6P8H797_ACTTE|nr:uncharacterized protein LOC116289481 [Actinia tenebrosa]
MRLINAPQEFTGVCRDILKAKWYRGICKEQPMGTSCSTHEFKLNGNPWCGGVYSTQAIHIRSMLCYIIQAFKAHGWKFLVSADVSAKFQQADQGPCYPVDVHSWWFVYEPESPPLQPTAPSYGLSTGSSAFPLPPSYDHDEVSKQ